MTQGPAVTLDELLKARDTRAALQRQLLDEHGGTLVCLTVNMPGPVKRCALADRLFSVGVREVPKALPGAAFSRTRQTPAGCEGYWCVPLRPEAVKRAMCRLENEHPLGRLWDIDVLGPDGRALSRRSLGMPARTCLLCGRPAAVCARAGAHPLPKLLDAMQQTLIGWESRGIGAQARAALEDEVRAAPKPGLVDALSCGAHTDMDIRTFLSSARALEPHFAHFAALGMRSAGQTPGALFDSLRRPGLDAERDMYAATGGVNTHKGAIFSLGLLCAAAGRLLALSQPVSADAVCRLCARMTAGLCARELPREAQTNGGRVYHRYGARGARGEAESGFAAVREVALPALRMYRKNGCGPDEALVRVLLRLMARVEDTNLLARRGAEQAGWVRDQALALTRDFSMHGVRALDAEMTRRGLSPGGCADLLAAALLLDRLESLYLQNPFSPNTRKSPCTDAGAR